MKSKFFFSLLGFALLVAPAHAGFWDNLSKAVLATNPVPTNAVAANRATTNLLTTPAATNVAAKPGLWSGIFPGGSPAALSQDQVGSGLKEALGKGVSNAVASLGRDGGYLANPNVKIHGMEDKAPEPHRSRPPLGNPRCGVHLLQMVAELKE